MSPTMTFRGGREARATRKLPRHLFRNRNSRHSGQSCATAVVDDEQPIVQASEIRGTAWCMAVMYVMILTTELREEGNIFTGGDLVRA